MAVTVIIVQDFVQGISTSAWETFASHLSCYQLMESDLIGFQPSREAAETDTQQAYLQVYDWTKSKELGYACLHD